MNIAATAQRRVPANSQAGALHKSEALEIRREAAFQFSYVAKDESGEEVWRWPRSPAGDGGEVQPGAVLNIRV
jgi:hypothetical protein